MRCRGRIRRSCARRRGRIEHVGIELRDCVALSLRTQVESGRRAPSGRRTASPTISLEKDAVPSKRAMGTR